MDYTDPSKLFCSEVASSAYHDVGMNLWMGLSTITRPGIRRWLSAVGVRHFETQEPSDLEYDPQLVVVAEWRDPATLWQDHVDNAVLDAMLEDADSGTSLDYSWYRLPLARLAKAYSTARVMAGGHGRQRTLAASVRQAADQLEQRQGYRPSYWTLLDLARREVAAGAL
jgi:hypothetical protein